MTKHKSWSADKIEQWPIDKLIPYARNARTHSAEQVAQIAASIAEFGFTNPILAGSDGVIVAGHGRLAAAQKLGLETVPVVVLDHLTKSQRRALIIADNRIAELSGWDDEMLRLELDDLSEDGFDTDLTGFDDGDYDGVIDGMPELKSGDKDPYQQKTFTLHDEQAAIVDDAVTLARLNPLADTGINENSNGNAIALICRQWVDAQGS